MYFKITQPASRTDCRLDLFWFVWVQFDPEQLADSASDVLWRQQTFLHHHVHADVDGQEAREFLRVGQIWLCDDA